MELFANNHKKGDIFQETKTGKWFIALEDASYQDAADLEDGWDINPGFGNGMYTVAREATEAEVAIHLAAIADAEAAHEQSFATLQPGTTIKVTGDDRQWLFDRYENKQVYIHRPGTQKIVYRHVKFCKIVNPS